MDCPICRGLCTKQISAICMWYGDVLNRYICDNCGLIFGPVETIALAPEELSKKYDIVYSGGFTHPDATLVELDTLINYMGAKPGNKYLNWGAGTTRTAEEAKKLGIELEEYDPWLPGKFSRDSLKSYDHVTKTKYDGIISNNWFEHCQNPIRDLKLQLSLLNNNSYIIHRTPCYKYVYEQCPYHLFFYEGDSVAKLADECNANFNIIEKQMIIIDPLYEGQMVSFWTK